MTLGQAGWEGRRLVPRPLSSKPQHGGTRSPVNDKAVSQRRRAACATDSEGDGGVRFDSVLIMFVRARGWIGLCPGIL